MTEEIKISFIKAELTKIGLEKGDVLMVKITTKEDIPGNNLKFIQDRIQDLFPNNRVMVLRIRDTDRLDLEVVKAAIDCGPQACEDCNCGKEEQLKALDELTAETEKLGLYKGDL